MEKQRNFRPLGFQARVPTNRESIAANVDGCRILGYSLLSPKVVRLTLQSGRDFEAPLEEALPLSLVRFLQGKLRRVEVVYEVSELRWSATAQSGPDFILERFEGTNNPQDPGGEAVPLEEGVSLETQRRWAAGEAESLAKYWNAKEIKEIHPPDPP